MIIKNFPLKKYNTFGLDYKSNKFISFKSEEETVIFLKDLKTITYPLFVIGSGSNLLFTRDFEGTILHPEIEGIDIEERHPDYVIISAGAGVNWDSLVEWTVSNGFGGLENLSLIPGTVGATPIQNIGAYGVEIKDFIVKVRAVQICDGSMHIFSNTDCDFGYRSSIFKNREKGNFLVTRVYYKLNIKSILNLNYGSLKDEVNNLGGISLKNVRQAVINIRRSKLPDPEITGNAGSFFKNPVVSKSLAESIKKNNPQMPVYDDQSGDFKLAAGWLIDQCGWKGKRIGDAGVHDKQALVIVNHGKATGKEIYDLSEAIKRSVFDRFGVKLEREVEVIGLI